MNHRKHIHPARTLRLESLENRSLLASGIMDFTVLDGNQHDRSNNDPVNHGSAQRHLNGSDHDSIRPQHLAKSRGDPFHGRNQPASNHRHSDPSVPLDQLARSPGVDAHPTQPQTELTPSVFFFAANPRADASKPIPNRVATTNEKASTTLVNPPPAGPQVQEIAPSSSLLTALAPAKSAPAKSAPAKSAPASSAPASSAQVDFARASSAVEENPPSLAGADEPNTNGQNTDSPNLLPRIKSNGVDSITTASRNNDAWIELAPFLESDEIDDTEGPNSEIFRLDLAVLSRLKDAIEPMAVDVAKASDFAFRIWLEGPGGMIALGRMDFPNPQSAFERIVVDVQLESTLALHRSLGLFATSSSNLAKLSLSDAMLDNIMTALGEFSESQTQPVIEQTKMRLRTFAYPIIGLTITGAALTARYRFRKENRSIQKLHPKPRH